MSGAATDCVLTTADELVGVRDLDLGVDDLVNITV